MIQTLDLDTTPVKLTSAQRCDIKPGATVEIPVNEFINIPDSNVVGKFFLRVAWAMRSLIAPDLKYRAGWSGKPSIVIYNGGPNLVEIIKDAELGELDLLALSPFQKITVGENEPTVKMLTLFETLTRDLGNIEDLKKESTELLLEVRSTIQHIVSFTPYSDFMETTFKENPFNVDTALLVKIKRLHTVLNNIHTLEMHGGVEAGYVLNADNGNSLAIRESYRTILINQLSIVVILVEGLDGLSPPPLFAR